MPLALDALTSLALARQLCPDLPDDLAVARVTGWSRARVRRWLAHPPALGRRPIPPLRPPGGVWRDASLARPEAAFEPPSGPLRGLLDGGALAGR